MKRFLVWFIFFCAISITCLASGVKAQAKLFLRGRVTDAQSGEAIISASVVLDGVEPLKGSATDINGEFLIEVDEAKRYRLKINHMAYKTKYIYEVQINHFVEIQMEASSIELDEIVVSPAFQKSEVSLSNAKVSAFAFTMEEANRYAGGFDDPARLANAFPGVASSIGNNALVIRGNNPMGFLWMMEGVEIPNPNHFADVASFGAGGLSALNSHLIHSADFLSSAFPVKYGNALSGVMDIRLKNGDSKFRKQKLGLSLLGAELAAEGPLKKDSQSTYLLSYRYSNLNVIKESVPDGTEPIIYQDGAFKFHLKSKIGWFDIWGLAAKDQSGAYPLDEEDIEFESDLEKAKSEQSFGVIGLKQTAILSKNAVLSTKLAYSISSIKHHQRKLDLATNSILPDYRLDFKRNDGIASQSININQVFNGNLDLGWTWTSKNYDLDYFDSTTDEAIINGNDDTWLVASYAQWDGYLSEKTQIVLGVNWHYFYLNGDTKVEPRVGLNVQLNAKQKLSFGLAAVSRLLPLRVYYMESLADKNNTSLKSVSAYHAVVAYEWAPTDDKRFKIEAFYQHLYNVPVVENETWSFINWQSDWLVEGQLTSTGLGRNYGLELSAEQFMKNGFYGMMNLSLFKSEYRDAQDVWHNSRYNRSYVTNVMFGKEWYLKKNGDKKLGLNIRYTQQGGLFLDAINEEASFDQKEVVYDQIGANFADQDQTEHILNLSIDFTITKPKHTSEWSIQIINLLGQKENQGFQYNLKKEKVALYKEALMIPNLRYRIYF